MLNQIMFLLLKSRESRGGVLKLLSYSCGGHVLDLMKLFINYNARTLNGLVHFHFAFARNAVLALVQILIP